MDEDEDALDLLVPYINYGVAMALSNGTQLVDTLATKPYSLESYVAYIVDMRVNGEVALAFCSEMKESRTDFQCNWAVRAGKFYSKSSGDR